MRDAARAEHPVTTSAERADRAQHGLTQHFGGVRAGSLRSHSRPRLGDLAAFNYWWLAHAVEVRVDAFERSGCPRWLTLAQKTYAGIRRRNGNSLFNDYFDDMSWLALAALRLFDATHESRYLADAESLWRHIVRTGYYELATETDSLPAIGWRRQQPAYTNAPTNGSFGILSARLFERTGRTAYSAFADSSLGYLETVLRDPGTGFLADGINRTGDGTIDRDWRFSYSQGLYIGAQLEAFGRDRDGQHLTEALRTARTTIETLAPEGVIAGENVDDSRRGGADIGLFKGVFYRYAADLAAHPIARAEADSASRGNSAQDVPFLTAFLVDSTDVLWQTFEPSLLSADDWRRFATRTVALSTELSAVLALEARARLDAVTGAAEAAS
ncbi:glycoside hydrolase family 76 protein [Subtercola lobariae]|uniref:Glycoside hydrolase n=1 Tax=Subtercola lobariae TaxID=1588641 RepID=A0A917B6G6_9MICO|nr:glycoside hydrolase family 76 protein [Subtercola lobariae]GGF27428.1 glycoside hydrolase [Subtercola lobariae]